MRLQPDHIAAIKRVTTQVLGDDARVALFGSHVDDRACGGDIDARDAKFRAAPSELRQHAQGEP